MSLLCKYLSRESLLRENDLSVDLLVLFQIKYFSYWIYIFFYKTTYLNNEAKCAELSLSVRIPWLKLLTINLYDTNPRSNVLTANCYFKAEKSVRMEKEWKIPLGEFLLKEKDPSVDLLVLTSSGQVLFILNIHFPFL